MGQNIIVHLHKIHNRVEFMYIVQMYMPTIFYIDKNIFEPSEMISPNSNIHGIDPPFCAILKVSKSRKPFMVS